MLQDMWLMILVWAFKFRNLLLLLLYILLKLRNEHCIGPYLDVKLLIRMKFPLGIKLVVVNFLSKFYNSLILYHYLFIIISLDLDYFFSQSFFCCIYIVFDQKCSLMFIIYLCPKFHDILLKQYYFLSKLILRGILCHNFIWKFLVEKSQRLIDIIQFLAAIRKVFIIASKTHLTHLQVFNSRYTPVDMLSELSHIILGYIYLLYVWLH